MSRYTALLLAGSRPGGDPFAERYGAEMKALIPIQGEPMVLSASVSRLRVEVGWSPRFTLEQGLADAIGWWKTRSKGAA